MLERARVRGLELERKPTAQPVVTGLYQLTSLGDTLQTWQGLLQGKSGVRAFNTNNARTNIAAPIEFDPNDYFSKKEKRTMAIITAMAIVGARGAGEMANVLGEDKRLLPFINKKRVSMCIPSGIGPTHNLIDISNSIHGQTEEDKSDNKSFVWKTDSETMSQGSRRVSAFSGLRSFPEQPNAQAAQALGASGWPINSSEACATGLAAIAEGARLIRDGYADIVFAGGVEEVLREHGEVGIASFASMKALSIRNEEPERASRPFDRDRDGFVLASGIGVVVLEREDSARKRGAKILAHVLGFDKTMDAYDVTEADPDRIADTIFTALHKQETKEDFYPVGAIFAHATSTPVGDKTEAMALRKVFGDELSHIPIAAIKSNLGHLVGAAGAVNAIAAILAVNQGKIPHIINLENPDEQFADLYFVRNQPLEKDIDTALALAYGFGGHNAAVLFGKTKD